MNVTEIRRRRLEQLLGEYGTQRELADAVGVEQNYISALKNGKKPFREVTARKIEAGARKPAGWLDQDETTPPLPVQTDWPFNIDRGLWDRLSPTQKREIEAAITKMILGANIEQAAAPPTIRKRIG